LTSESYKLTHPTIKLSPHYLAKCKKIIFKQYSTLISIKQLTFQSRPTYKHPHNTYRPKTTKNITGSPTLQPVSKVHRQIHGLESVYTTIRLAHPQCAAGMQSVSETDAAATLAE